MRVASAELMATWRARLDRYEVSDLTVARFCEGEGVSVPSFYQWRRRLNDMTSAKPQVPEAPVGFMPVRIVGNGPSSGADVRVFLPGGTRLEIPVGDATALAEALRAVIVADAMRREELASANGRGRSC